MKPLGRPFLTSVTRRLYSAQAAAQTDPGVQPLPRQQPKVTRLPNGVTVASLENYRPVSRVCAVFQAGARNEPGDQLGLTHCLRRAAFLGNEQHSQFALAKNIQQTGGNLTCSSGRDTMVYSLEAIRDSLDGVVEYLASATTSPKFTPWEINDNVRPMLAFDAALLQQSPYQLTLEALHDAAYKGTLGRPLYAPKSNIGKFTPDMLENYMRNYYTSERLTLVGLGVDHETMLDYASRFTPVDGPGIPTEKAAYRAGEIRVENGSSVVHAAIVTEGASTNSKDLLALAALQRVMGSGEYIKWGSNVATSKVQQTATGITPRPVAVSCFNANYSDSGLFGFYVTAMDTCVGKVIQGIAKQFSAVTKSGVSQEDLDRAKAQLKSAILMSSEDPTAVISDLAAGVDITDVEAKIDALTVADVSSVAKRVINGRPSMAAVGNLANVPYLDQVFQ